MASRFVNRASLSSLKSAINSSKSRTPSSRIPPPPSTKPSTSSSATPLGRFSSITTRSPSHLGCVQSLLPLHSALAIARLTSCLSLNSSSCRALSQGSRTYPGL